MTRLRLLSGRAPRLAPWGLALFLLLPAGCADGPPLEARLVELQERKLWRAEAEVYAPEEYRAYLGLLRSGKDLLIAAERRFAWFRDYEPATRAFREALALGDEIHASVLRRREERSERLARSLVESRSRIERLETLTSLVSIGRAPRALLARAELMLREAEAIAAKGGGPEAERRLAAAEAGLAAVREAATTALRRFVDRDLVSAWRRRVAETIRESRVHGTYAIVVSKVDRRLVLYKGGRAVRTYDVGLGSASVNNKAYAGDRATPEGSYRVVRKIPDSRYSKALLLDYPNAEDRRRFAEAKRRGEIPRRAGIGGLIEIHGGGREGLTLGCVALDDHHMDELYAIAGVGMPVTIVGAIDFDNAVALALKEL